MSKVYYSQPRTAYDEEQAYQRHLAYLKTQANVSQQFQDAYRNELLGVPPTVPQVPTATEVLENQMELDKAVQKYLRMLVPDMVNPPRFDDTKETIDEFVRRTQPAKYVFDNLSPAQKRTLVQNFPAIQAELKNYQFIDANFLLEYLDKYQEAFDATGGVSRLNRTNLALTEIRGLLEQVPTRATIYNLEDEIKDAIGKSKESTRKSLSRRFEQVMSKLDELKTAVPPREEVASLLERAVQLGQESVMEGKEMTDVGVIERLAELLEKLPTEDAIRNLAEDFATLKKEGGASEAEVISRLSSLEGLVMSIPRDTMFKIMDLYEYLQRQNLSIEGKEAPQRRQYTRPRARKEAFPPPPSLPSSSSKSISSYFPPREKQTTTVEEFQPHEPISTISKGVGFGSTVMANRFKHKVQPKFTSMVGKGLSIKEDEPSYIEFGKFALSKNHLNKGQLCVRSIKNGNYNPSLPTCEISEDFVDILENFLQTEKLNERALKKLDKKEKNLFSTLLNKSGLYGKYKIKVAKSEEEIEEEERFNLVKGEIIAGNDNPEIVKELKRFLMKFVLEGRIPKREAHELLFQLTFI